jgi:hypothetical protein
LETRLGIPTAEHRSCQPSISVQPWLFHLPHVRPMKIRTSRIEGGHSLHRYLPLEYSGQIALYLKDNDLRFGFISTYSETIFLRQELVAGQYWELQHSAPCRSMGTMSGPTTGGSGGSCRRPLLFHGGRSGTWVGSQSDWDIGWENRICMVTVCI